MNLLAAAPTTPLWVVLGYLVLLLGLGVYSSRFFKGTSRDYFVASRSIGPFLLLMSVFGTTMTAFALVGSTGEAFKDGIAVYGALASWSGLVHSTVFFLVGIRLWAIGKRNGYVTQVQFFRDRFQSQTLGYVLFALLVLLVIPYLLIGILGAGKFVAPTTDPMFDTGWLTHGIPPWLTGLVVCGVVLTYVFLGGIRSAAWANAFQTIIFMTTGLVAFFMISHKISHDIDKQSGGILQSIHDANKYVEKQKSVRHKLVRGVHAEDEKDHLEQKRVYRDELNNYSGALKTWDENNRGRLLELTTEHAGDDEMFQLNEFRGLNEKSRQLMGLVLIQLSSGNEIQQQAVMGNFPDFNATREELKGLHDACLKQAGIDEKNDEDIEIKFEAEALIALQKPVEPTEPEDLKDTMPHLVFLTFLFVPLSVAMFPHVFQHWLTAKSAKTFRLPIVAHPICIAIVWLPCVLVGVWAAGLYAANELQLPMIPGPNGEQVPNSNAVLGAMVGQFIDNPWLVGLVMIGVLAAIMSSLDSQFVCLGTMFTNDIFLPLVDEHDYTDRQKVRVARLFTVGVVAASYGLSLLWHSKSVFDIGIWCFTGFAALTPLVFAALFWKRVTTAGAYACIAVTVVLGLFLFSQSDWGNNRDYLVAGMKPVAPLTLISAASLVIVSLLTTPPSKETLRKFFPSNNRQSNNNKQQSGRPQEQKGNPDRRQNYGNRNRRGRRPRRSDSGGQ